MTRTYSIACAIASATALFIAGCHNSAMPRMSTNEVAPRGAMYNGIDRSPSAAPNHVLTWADIIQDDNISPTAAAPYLTWASVTIPDANAFSQAGIKTIFYTDPNRTSPGQRMYTNDESTFAHDCNGNRITIVGKPGPKYQMDPTSGDLANLWKYWVDWILKGGVHYDAIFDDSADSIRDTSAKPCGFNQQAWTEASNLMNDNLGQNIIFNGLGSLTDGFDKPPPSIMLNPSTFGGMLEGCYANGSIQNPLPKGVVWKNYETTELTMNTQQEPFVCRGISTFPAQTSISQRVYMYASFLLTYNPATSIISEKFSTPSNLGVFPEETFVALNPVIPAPASVSALQTSKWTFGRQYAACYLWGQPIGTCAAVVNADGPNHAHPFPWPGVYQHTHVLSGAGILDGGTANVAGPAPSSVVPGTSAVIAIQ
jgi:hypothetical protein